MSSQDKIFQVAIVEDDALIALDIATTIEDAGFQIQSTSSTLKDALSQARDSAADIFTLDCDLHGEDTESVAKVLNDRDIPYVVISSQKKWAESRSSFKSVKCFGKPFCPEEVISELRSLLK